MRRLPAHGVEVDGVSLDTYLADLKARIVALEAGGAIPQAAFTMNPTSGTAPLTVSFTDTSTGAPDTWAWDFGDGATSTLQNPSHEYTTDGTYTVSLTVSNAYGNTSTTRTITVDAAPAYVSTVVADSPLAYWRLGETSGTFAADASGNGRDLTWRGTPTLGVAGLLAGDPDKAADFSGDDYADIADAAWMDVSTVTLEAVIQPAQLTANAVIIDRDDYNTARVFQFRTNEAGKLELVFWTTTSGPLFVAGATTLTVGQKYHVAATYDGSVARVYLNGVEDGSLTQAGTLQTSAGRISVGANRYTTQGYSAGFSGRIDEPAVYGTALPPARVVAHHAAAFNTA